MDLNPILSPAVVDLYASLNIVSIVLLVILTLTIVLAPSNRIKRDPTLINAFIVIIIVNVLDILYYIATGGQIGWDQREDIPHKGVCKVQAGLLAGSQAGQAAAIFALVFRLWSTTMSLSVPWFYNLKGKAVLGILLALPYVCILSFTPPTLLHIGKYNDQLTPTPFYCQTLNVEFRSIYQNLTLAFAVLCLILECHLIYLLTRHFNLTSRATTQIITSLNQGPHPRTSSTQPLQHLPPQRHIKVFFFVRVSVFIAWTLLVIAVTLYQAFDKTITDPESDVVFAFVGPLAFFCFASQPDILQLWRIPTSTSEWRRRLSSRCPRQKCRQRRKTSEPIQRELDLTEFLGGPRMESQDESNDVEAGMADYEVKEEVENAVEVSGKVDRELGLGISGVDIEDGGLSDRGIGGLTVRLDRS